MAVWGLNFEVSPGEVFGLLGPNGAGKTTTVRMLTGLLTPSEGDAFVDGLSVITGGESLRRRVGLLTEQPGLYDRLTARENLLFFIKLNGLDEKPAMARAMDYLGRFEMRGRENEPCGRFSKGMRQKLAIVRTLLHQPPVLFLDEPTSGLDPEAARSVRDAIAELAESGKTIVLCSHNLSEVERLCRRVAIVKTNLRSVENLSQLRQSAMSVEIKLRANCLALAGALKSLSICRSVATQGDALKIGLLNSESIPQIVQALVEAGAQIESVIPINHSLEDLYLRCVNESHQERQ